MLRRIWMKALAAISLTATGAKLEAASPPLTAEFAMYGRDFCLRVCGMSSDVSEFITIHREVLGEVARLRMDGIPGSHQRLETYTAFNFADAFEPQYRNKEFVLSVYDQFILRGHAGILDCIRQCGGKITGNGYTEVCALFTAIRDSKAQLDRGQMRQLVS